MSRLFETLATLFHALQCFRHIFFFSTRAVSFGRFSLILVQISFVFIVPFSFENLYRITHHCPTQAILWLVRFVFSFISSKSCLAPVMVDLMMYWIKANNKKKTWKIYEREGDLKDESAAEQELYIYQSVK